MDIRLVAYTMTKPLTKPPLAGIAVLILHLVGAAGMLLPDWRSLIIGLTPFHLVTVGALTILSQEKKTARFFFFCLLCFLAGFAVEWIGVHTGWPFGDYSYGPVLGPQAGSVPLLIGLNWLVLTLTTASVVRSFSNPWVAAAAGAALMVGIDWLMEPVAVAYDYWQWHSGKIPVENYIAWGLVGYGLHWLLRWMKIHIGNAIASYVLASQLIFFLLIRLLGS